MPLRPNPTERRRRRNHLGGKVIARYAPATGVADEAAEVVVVRPVPVHHERRGPLVDVVEGIGQLGVRPDHQNRAEDFFTGDSHALVDIAHDGRCDLAGTRIG